MDKVKKVAAWVSVCVACVGSAEGLRQTAYQDPIGIWTGCFGETKDIKPGDRWTKKQCEDKLGARIEEFGRGVDECVKVALPPARKAAFTSTAYNIGVAAFCRSSMVRKINAGDVQGACDALLLYVKAGGVTFPGLVKRREQEREMCLEGVS